LRRWPKRRFIPGDAFPSPGCNSPNFRNRQTKTNTIFSRRLPGSLRCRTNPNFSDPKLHRRPIPTSAQLSLFANYAAATATTPHPVDNPEPPTRPATGGNPARAVIRAAVDCAAKNQNQTQPTGAAFAPSLGQ